MIEATKLAELQVKHGDLALVPTKLGDLAFRTPTLEDHERWQEKVATDKSSKTSATREYVLSALVFPDREIAIGIIEKLPAVTTRIAAKLAELAGSEIEIEIKKA